VLQCVDSVKQAQRTGSPKFVVTLDGADATLNEMDTIDSDTLVASSSASARNVVRVKPQTQALTRLQESTCNAISTSVSGYIFRVVSWPVTVGVKLWRICLMSARFVFLCWCNYFDECFCLLFVLCWILIPQYQTRDWLGRASLKWPVMYWEGRKFLGPV